MSVLDDFIGDARKVPLETVFDMVEGTYGRKVGGEHVGQCPACGGKDRFSINLKDQVWLCRHYDGRGGDGLALMAHRHGLDLKRRAEFLLACSMVQGGRPIPEGGERETEEERGEREKRNAERKAAAEADHAKNEKADSARRERAITRGRGIYFNAGDGAGSEAETYLKRRTGAEVIPTALWENLRFQPEQSYWHGRDDRGHDRELHCGAALIAPLVDLTGHITGCHQTWIDLANGPKFRPALLDEKGEPLPTKKMQGAKKGSIIPVLGDLNATRWVVGEGIETVLAIASAEQWRGDTFYVAAGDIGNMAGPADPGSSFDHPSLKKADTKGRIRPVRVPGPLPKPGIEDDAFQLMPAVTELVLLADGDSEFMNTASAMARAETRLGRAGLSIETWWPPRGEDWSETMNRCLSGSL